MDEKPKCSHDIDPITQQPTKKDQSAAQKDQMTLPEVQTPATKAQTVLKKESPACFEDQSTAPMIQTVITIDQTIYSIEQPALLKDQPVYSKEELAHPEEQPTAYSKDLLAGSKIQNALIIDYPAAYSKDQVAYSKNTNALTIDQPAASFPEFKSSSFKEQTTTSTIHIDSIRDELCSSKDETSLEKIHTTSTQDESASSRELTITSKIKIASTTVQSSFPIEEKYILTTESGSTNDYESTMMTTPKKIVEAIMENYSKKIEPGISLCAARPSVIRSHHINSGYLSSNAPLKISSCTQSPITTHPKSQLPLATAVAVPTQPPSLFLQALSKLNESSVTLAAISHFQLQSSSNLSKVYKIESGEITPPDSLSSAPPTYSFVLRQLAVRRRPRFMGTFFPSPSFVQHAPPPTYTGAFDVYIEPALPPPPTRIYNFGFASMPIVCPECGYTGMTVVTSHITICTHLCAFLLCLLCCWICAPLPYVLRSCKDVYHYCRNCRSFLGMYCPTNPESTAYPNVP